MTLRVGDQDDSEFHSLGDVRIVCPDDGRRWCALVHDWTPVELEADRNGNPAASGLQELQKEHWSENAASYARFLLQDSSSALREDLLAVIEEYLQTRISSAALTSALLISPLKNTTSASEALKAALAGGFGATASILNSIIELQPQLSRLTDSWLSLDDGALSGSSLSPQRLWATVIKSTAIVNFLQAGDRLAFSSSFLRVLTHLSAVDRTTASSFLNSWARSVHPQATDSQVTYSDGDREKPSRQSGRSRAEMYQPRLSTHDTYEAVLKQIATITDLLAQGRDQRATLFIRELITQQASDPQYAVKSLCNIAQRCKEMFRGDKEKECLDAALQLGTTDARLLIQYGDLLKRAGEFDKAREILRDAVAVGAGRSVIVAQSSLADILHEQGQHDPALEAYRSINGWKDDPTILTAIADIERKLGRFDVSSSMYDNIVQRWPQEERAVAGLAELAKRQSRYKDAIELYSNLLSRKLTATKGSEFWRLSLAHVYKLTGNYTAALNEVDAVIQESPFLMKARAQRSSILGLLGEEVSALADLPRLRHRPLADEWSQQYVRGLLLHKLDRLGEARQELVDNYVGGASLAEDSSSRLRLAAAVCLLGEDDTRGAVEHLDSISGVSTMLEEFLARILRLHIAVAEADQARVATLTRELSRFEFNQPLLRDAFEAVRSGDLRRALRLEVQALLIAA